MKIEVHAGDVFDVTDVMALVNPGNCQPSMSWGSHVNETLRKRGGVELVSARKKAGKIELGQVVLTGAGSLPYEYILHAAVLDMFDFNPLFLLKLKHRTSQETLEAAMRNILRVSREHDIDSLVLTPMGAGIGGMPIELCASILLGVLREHPEHPTLERVVIAAHRERDAEILRRTWAD